MSTLISTENTRPISSYLFKRSKVRLIGLLALPMFWIVGVYIVSLFLLLITAFWLVDPFTSLVRPGFTLDNFISIFTVQAYLATSLRTLLAPLGIRGPGFSIPIVFLTLTYLWFPYMALPVFTAIRQIPTNLFDASSDLGAKGFFTIYRVVLPLIVPAIIAGSVFTFSLSLGDYLAARFTGGKTQMIGSIIASNINLNPPVAAAFSMVPIAFVVIYLVVARRTGSLERM